MVVSLLKKIVSGKNVNKENKLIVKSLFLCNLSHKAILSLLKHEASQLNIYLDFMDVDYSDAFSFIHLNQDSIAAFKPELIFVLFDESYYLDKDCFCKSIEDIEKNIQNIKKTIDFLFQILGKNASQKPRFIFSSLPYHKLYFNHYISLSDRDKIRSIIADFDKTQCDAYNSKEIQYNIIDLSDFHGKVIEDIYTENNTVASLDFLNYFAEAASKYLRLNYGKTIKCIITDLDNTFWDGIIADDGIEKVLSSEKKHFFDIYQKWLKEMYDQGIILSIASKNDKELIQNIFQQYKNQFSIDWDQFAFPEINWEKKSINIKKICENLNISPEHVLFIDDNLFECEEVKYAIPEISIFHFSSDIRSNLNQLLQDDFFIKQSVTTEDKIRNKKFSQDILRKQIQATSINNDDFLQKLKMKLFYTDRSSAYLQRLSDLTLRTNQFNLMTIRMNVKDIQTFGNQQNNRFLVFSCQDQLGEYGIIGCAFITIMKERCHINNMILSCRVFERQIEFGMMDVIIQYACKYQCRNLTGDYCETSKNKRFSSYYLECGFQQIKTGFFQGNLNELYVQNKHPYVEIKELNHEN